MAIEHGMWRIGSAPFKLQPVKMENEGLLEELITKDISILNDGWLLIGHHLRTGFDKLATFWRWMRIKRLRVLFMAVVSICK